MAEDSSDFSRVILHMLVLKLGSCAITVDRGLLKKKLRRPMMMASAVGTKQELSGKRGKRLKRIFFRKAKIAYHDLISSVMLTKVVDLSFAPNWKVLVVPLH